MRKSCGRPATTAVTAKRSFGSAGGTRALRGEYAAPPGQQASLHVLDRDGVAEVVPPGAVDMQVAAAQALLVEAEFFHHAPARVVLRADARLDPVQPHHEETMVDRHGQRRGGHPAARN